MLVRDHMTPHPITLQVDADYKSAVTIMHDHAIHHLPVLDANKKLAGIIAERDLLLAASHYLGSVADVGEVMHRDVVTVAPNVRVTDAASLMIKHTIGGLPVVDRRGRVVGVITETDIFKAFVQMLKPAATPAGNRTRPQKKGVARRSAMSSGIKKPKKRARRP